MGPEEAATHVTPEDHVLMMKACCVKANSFGIGEFVVEDWGRFSNFSVSVYPARPSGHATRSIRAVLAKVLPVGAHLREVHAPDRDRSGQYVRDFWAVDVDFKQYDPQSNEFN